MQLARNVVARLRGRYPPGVTREDALQEAYGLILWHRPIYERVKPDVPWESWVVMRVSGVMRDYYARMYCRLTKEKSLSDTSSTDTSSDIRIDMLAALARLTERERRAVLMWRDGYTQHEIADAIGMTQGRVSQLISSACQKLRVLLSSYGQENDG